MKKRLIGFLLLACLVGGCGQQKDNEEDVVKFLDVQFAAPENVMMNEPVALQAKVTYGDEAVTDADEMKFEIWYEDDQEHSETVEGVHTDNGLYEVEKTFTKKGTYHAYAHVTAESMHSMPKITFEVTD